MKTFLFGYSRKWRGLVFEQTLFGPVMRLGWLTFGVSKYDLPDWVKEWHGKLEAALGKAKPSNGKGQQR